MRSRLALAAILLPCAPLAVPAAELKGLWEFDNPGDIGAATIGNPLVVGGVPTHHASLSDDLGTSLSGAVTTSGTTASYFSAAHDIPANGGGSFVNKYTVVVDLFTPVASRGAWRAIFQTSGTPAANDADYWIRNTDDHVGVAAIGYSDAPVDSTAWMRLVVTVDLTKAGSDVETFVNGALFYSHPANQGVDGRHSLFPLGDTNIVHFFGDDSDDENPPMNVGLIGIYDGVLTPVEIALLGMAGDPIQGPPATELRWTGAASGEWSEAVLVAPKNWVLASDGVTPADFTAFDKVTFDDSASTTSVALADGDVGPGGITVMNDLVDYVFAGPGGIIDPATLTKEGAGALTLDMANTFRGATTINGGALVLGNALALQNSPVELASGTALDFGSLSAATIGGLSGSADLVLQNSAAVPQAVALTVNGGGRYGGVLSGPGGLTKTGSGSLGLTNPSSYAGTTIIAGGRIEIEDPGALGTDAVALAGGALGFSFGDGSSEVYPNNVTLPGIGQACFVMKGDAGTNITVPTTVELAGVISGGAPGEVFRFIDTDDVGNHNNIFVLSNEANSFEGTIQMWRGTLAITSDAVLGDPENDIQHYTENINGALRFDAPGITLNANRELNFPGAANVRPIDTQGFDAEIAGTVTGSANLIKRGSGALTLSGGTIFGGTVQVAEGTLALAGAADLGGAGEVAVNAGAVLDVSGAGPGFTLFASLLGEGEVRGAMSAFGAVSPGAAANAIGVLTTGSISFDFFFNADVDSDFLESDRLVVQGDLALTSNAELILFDLAPVPTPFPPGTKLALIEYTGSWNGGTFLYFDGAGLGNIADGANVTLDGTTFVIDYDDTSDGVKTGKFVTLTVPSSGGNFAGWAVAEGLDGSPGREAGFGDNPDRDPLANGLEWILGGNPLAPDGTAVLPAVEGDVAAGLTMTFTREEDSIGAAMLDVEWNTDLGAQRSALTVGPTDVLRQSLSPLRRSVRHRRSLGSARGRR